MAFCNGSTRWWTQSLTYIPRPTHCAWFPSFQKSKAYFVILAFVNSFCSFQASECPPLRCLEFSYFLDSANLLCENFFIPSPDDFLFLPFPHHCIFYSTVIATKTFFFFFNSCLPFLGSKLLSPIDCTLSILISPHPKRIRESFRVLSVIP